MTFNEAAMLILSMITLLFTLAMLLAAGVTVLSFVWKEQAFQGIRSIKIESPRSTIYGGVKGTLMPIVSIPPFGESSDPKARVWWDG